MKFWEAMLIGCDKRGKACGDLFYYYPDGTCLSCALGAAYEGATGNHFWPFGGTANFGVDTWIGKRWPWLTPRVIDRIVRLNDQENWTRERIALEYVKPIEEGLVKWIEDPS